MLLLRNLILIGKQEKEPLMKRARVRRVVFPVIASYKLLYNDDLMLR